LIRSNTEYRKRCTTCSGVELEDDATVADAERDEVAESGRVVRVVEQYSVVVAGRLEHEPNVDREQGVSNRVVRYERRTIELGQTDPRTCQQHTHSNSRHAPSWLISHGTVPTFA